MKSDLSIDNNFDKNGRAITTRDISDILNTERQNNSIEGPCFCEQILRSSKYKYRTPNTYNSQQTLRAVALQKNE